MIQICFQRVVFDKTAFVKFKISNNFKQNIDETDLKNQKSVGKSIPAYGFKKSQEKNSRTKSLKTFAKSLWFPIKNP
jgi:hypothetical protein